MSRLDALKLDAAKYRARRREKHTRRTYEIAWTQWSTWCAENDIEPLTDDAELVAAWLTALSYTCRAATLRVRLAGLRFHLDLKVGRDNNAARDPLVGEVLEGISRTIGTKQDRKAALTADLLQKVLDALDIRTNRGKRDRALFLTAFLTGMRSSEVCRLRWEHVAFPDEGVTIDLRKSKTDARGEGRVFGLHRIPGGHCPRVALTTWKTALRQAERTIDGDVFRTVHRTDSIGQVGMCGKSVTNAIKAAAKVAGLNHHEITGHSFRIGLINTLQRRGVSASLIQQRTGHKTAEMLHRYSRLGTEFSVDYSALTGLRKEKESQ